MRVRAAKFDTRPSSPPALIGAALSAETAEWMGGWADGLITAGASAAALRSIVDAFHRGGGRGKRLVLQAAVSYVATDDEALSAAADGWRHAVLAPEALAALDCPAAFDAAAQDADPRVLRERLHVAADVERHVRWLEEAAGLGSDEIYLHHVGRDLERFLAVFAERVLPALARRTGIAA